MNGIKTRASMPNLEVAKLRSSTFASSFGAIRSRTDDFFSLPNILPPLFICLMIGTVWYIYLSLHLLPLLQITSLGQPFGPEARIRGFVQFATSQVLFFLLALCYARSVICSPGSVPTVGEWKMGSSAAVPMTREVKITGERRHCKWCLMYKPDRCHHCRICKSCILKMDHHCPWIMNCVGFRNHKYFFLLVVYSVLSCWFINITVLESVKRSMEQDIVPASRFLLVLCMTLSVIMGSLMTVFLGFHTWLMLQGMTTIEFCEKTTFEDMHKKRGRYDGGLYKNLTAVLGPNPLFWLLPCSPPVGDGVDFKVYTSDNIVEADDPEWTSHNRGSIAAYRT